MLRQLDLLGHAALEIKPEAGCSEPRLWVRRFVIWSEPGVMLREIRLRPGLNIVWAPDPADQSVVSDGSTTLGHGSGKTLFCRLLRYCLGEDRFAPGEVRERIAGAFPEGRVGAEVMLNGTRWSLVRPIGVGRRHLAIREADLDQVAIGDEEATGMAPFLEAAVTSLLSNEVATLFPGGDSTNAWQVALAWLSRDQECRFDKLLDWRSADSESGSPARNFSAQQRQDALRALIGAIVPKEFELRAEVDELEASHRNASQDATRLEWAAGRLRTGLARELGVDPGDLFPGRMAVEPLRAAAKANMARLTRLDSSVDASSIDVLRLEFDRARQRVETLQSRESALQGRIPEIKKLIDRINGEMPAVSARAGSLALPVCPVCEVPIDRALAEGCKLSHKLPNLDEVKQRLQTLKGEHAAESRRFAESHEELTRTARELHSAREHSAASYRQLQEAEQIRDAQSNAWFSARRLIDDVDRLDQLLVERDRMQSLAATQEREIESKRERTAAFREAQTGVFDSL